MKNIMNQKGFTLIEMLIVLLIISVLILITVPNLTKHNDLSLIHISEPTRRS